MEEGEEIEGWMISDNAGCYQSKLLKILIGLINIKHAGRFFLTMYPHSETQRGKSDLDCKFGVSSNHTLKYMLCKFTNKARKIKTPAGLALSLSWNGGVKNAVFQLVRIDRSRLGELSGGNIKKVSDKLSDFFSRANAIHYYRPDQAVVDAAMNPGDGAVIFGGMDISKVKFTIGVEACSDIDRIVKFDVDLGKGTVAIDSKGQCEIDRILEGKPDEGSDGGENGDDDEEIIQDEEDSMVPTGRVEVDHNIDELNLCDHFSFARSGSNSRLWRCSECKHVNVSGGSSCRSCKCARAHEVLDEDQNSCSDDDGDESYSSGSSSSDDESCLIHLSDLEYDSGAESDDTEPDTRGIKGYLEPNNELHRPPKTVSGVEVLRHSRFDVKGDIARREKSTIASVERKIVEQAKEAAAEAKAQGAPQKSSETGPAEKRKRGRKKKKTADRDPARRQDVVAQAVRMASDHVNSPEADIRCGKVEHPLCELAEDFTIAEDEMTRQGWGRRLGRGDGGMYGTKYIAEHRDDVRIWFEEGKKDKHKKAPPGTMRERLIKKYPNNKYTIPGESEIRAEISKLMDEASKSPTNRRNLASPLPAYVVAIVEEIVEQNRKMKPEPVYARLVEKVKSTNNGSLPSDFPEGQSGKKKIKSKISALKQKHAKMAKQSVVDS